MRELLRTNDIVLLSFIKSLLDEAGIGMLVADEHMSHVEGSLGMLPRRVLVHDRDLGAAQALLLDAGVPGLPWQYDKKPSND